MRLVCVPDSETGPRELLFTWIQEAKLNKTEKHWQKESWHTNITHSSPDTPLFTLENTYAYIPPQTIRPGSAVAQLFQDNWAFWDMGYCCGTLWLGMQESWGGLANLPQSLEADGVTNDPIPSPQTLPAFQMAHLTLSDWHKGRVPGAGHTSSPMACVTVYTTPSQRH